MGKNFEIKTKSWKITLIVVSIILLFLIIILLIGEFDLLDVDYIVAKNGVLWHGRVTLANKDWLLEHFSKYGLTEAEIEQYLNLPDPIQILNRTNNIILNLLLFGYLIPALSLSILLPCFLRLCRLTSWDVLPFSFAAGIASFSFIITALIDYWEDAVIWWYLLRIFIFIVVGVVGFLISNAIVKQAMKRSIYASQYINELKSEKLAADKVNRQSDAIFDSYRKHKDESVIKYVEVEKEKDMNNKK